MSTLELVRNSIAQIIGDDALRHSEESGRLVIARSADLLPLDAQAQVGVNVMSSITGDAGLSRFIAQIKEAKMRAIRAIGDVNEGQIFQHKSRTKGTWQMILADASEPGKWRIQSFDAKGFSGHMVFADKTAAIESLAINGYTVRDDDALDRMFETPAFQRGLYTTDLIGQVNMGRLDFSSANELLAKYDMTHSAMASVVSKGAQAFVAGDGRTMFMIADRIHRGTEGAVFLHEITHRWGKPMMDPTSWSRLIGRLHGWADHEAGSVERRIHDLAVARVLAAKVRPHQKNDELFAYAVEVAVNLGVTPSAAAHEDSAQAWLDDVVKTLEQTLLSASMAGPGGHIEGFPKDAQQLVDLAYAMAQMESPQRAARIWERFDDASRKQLSELMQRQGLKPAVADLTDGHTPWYFNKLQALIDAAPGRLDGAGATHWAQWIGLNHSRVLSQQTQRDALNVIGLMDLLEALDERPVTAEDLRQFIQTGGVFLRKSPLQTVASEVAGAGGLQCLDMCLPQDFALPDMTQTLGRLWVQERNEPGGKRSLLVHEVATLHMGESQAALALEAFELEMRTQYAEYLIANSLDMQGSEEGRLRFVTRVAKKTDLNEILSLLNAQSQYEDLKQAVAAEASGDVLARATPKWEPLVRLAIKRLASYAAANGFDELVFANPFTRFNSGLDAPVDATGTLLTPTGITHDCAVIAARQLSQTLEGAALRSGSVDSIALDAPLSARLLSAFPAFDTTRVADATQPQAKPDREDDLSVNQQGVQTRWYFSQLERALMSAPKRLQGASGGQWAQWLESNVSRLGIKAQELHWTGIREWLALMQGEARPLQRSDLVGFARANGVHVQDVVESGNPAYAQYKTDGGENYREILLTLPVKVSTQGWTTQAYRADAWKVFDEIGALVGNFPAEGEQEALELAKKHRQEAPEQRRGRDFKSSHWSVSNVLAHVRLDDRLDEHGQRVLMVHEIQSDWAAQARSQVQANVPDAPFINQPKDWVSLALKRILAMAVEGNYQRVAFATGEQVIERFTVSNGLSRIEFTLVPQNAKNDDAVRGRLRLFDLEGNTTKDSYVLASELPAIVGKALATALLDDPSPSEDEAGGAQFVLEGEPLKLAGQGLAQLYDTIIPNVLNDLLRKLKHADSGAAPLSVLNETLVSAGAGAGQTRWTVEFEDGTQHNSAWSEKSIALAIAKPEMGDRVVPAGLTGTRQPGIDITPALSESIGKGLPLFSLTDTVLLTTAGDPLVVYRGEHSDDGQWLKTRLPSLAFGTVRAANIYAQSPNDRTDAQSAHRAARVMAAHLVMNNPLVNQPDDPFIEMAVIVKALGLEKAQLIAARFDEAIQGTSAWLEHGQGFTDVRSLLLARAQDVELFYVDAYLLLDDPEIVGWLKEAGFDGAIHSGNAATAMEPEYRVFSESQVLPVWSSGSIVDELSLTESGVMARVNAFLDYWQQHEDGPDAPYEDCVGLASKLITGYARSLDVVAEFAPWAPFGMTTGIELTDLFAAEPGMGAGSKVMSALIAVTQQLGLPLYLRPSGPRSREFYARFGFERASYGFLAKYPFAPEDEPPEPSGGKPRHDNTSVQTSKEEVMASFAGVQALGANHVSLHMALARIASGTPADLVRQETGWFEGVDGKWRFEIDDRAAFLKGVGNFGEIVMKRHAVLNKGAEPVYLSDILTHPALFAAYPRLAKLEVEFMPKGSTALGQLVGMDTVRIAEHLHSENALSVIVHELQHGIQYVEGFAIGGSPSERAWLNQAMRPVLIAAAQDAMASSVAPSYELYWGGERTPEGEAAYASFLQEWHSPEYQARLERASQGGAAAKVYGKLAGEIESRDVQARLKMSQAQRHDAVPALMKAGADDVVVVFAGSDQGLLADAALSAPKTLDEVREIWRTLGIEHSLFETRGYITLSQIVVPYNQRQQGLGSQAMRALVAYADATGQVVGLSPSTDFGATSKVRLQKFYRQFGFTVNTGRARDFTTQDTMLRQPGPSASARFDFSLPDQSNVIRRYKVGSTEIALDANANTGQVHVASIRTPVTERGQGSARAAMMQLLAQADEQGVELTLHASALDKRTNQRRLEAFYASLGFANTGRTINPMHDPEMRRVAIDHVEVESEPLMSVPEPLAMDDLVGLASPVENPDIASVLIELGKDKAIYQFEISSSASISEIAKSKGLIVRDIDKNTDNANLWLLCNSIVEGPGIESWLLQFPDGGYGTLTNDNGRVYINVSGVGEGHHGSRMYDLASNYAFNNNLKFVGDPHGFSEAAMRRRLENMLSAAVKYGSTDFLEPHPDQIKGNEDIGVSPLDWTNGDTNANILSMVEASIAATERSNPIGATLEYDYLSNSFKDASGGSIPGAAEIRAYAGLDGRSKGAGQAGVATLCRHALFKSLLSSQASRSSFLERLHRQRGQRGQIAAGELHDIFYSHAASSELTTPAASTKRLHVQRGQHGSDVLRASNGEAGDGIYAFFPRSHAMRRYYTGEGERLWDIDLDANRVVDLTQAQNMADLLRFANEQFKSLSEQMPGYIVPLVNAKNIQRFGRIIEAYVQNFRPWAGAWVVPHHGPGAPSGKQVVIADESVIVASQSRPGHRENTVAMSMAGKSQTAEFAEALGPVKDQIYHELVAAADCGPFDGGCVLFAQALQKVIGGEVYVLTRAGDGSADHAAVLLNGMLYDFDGPLEPQAFCQRFAEQEFVDISGYRPIAEADLGQAVRDAALEARLVDLLTSALKQTTLVTQSPPTGEAQEGGDLDWMAALFGQEGIAAQPPTPPTPALDLVMLIADLHEFARDKQEQANDWAARVYKVNAKAIRLEGDGPVRNASISVTQANESRRRRMVESLNAQVQAATALASRIESGLDVANEIEKVNAALLSDIARDGRMPSVYPDRASMFEAYISSMLLGDGGRTFGAGSLAGLIRATWESAQAEVPSEHDGLLMSIALPSNELIQDIPNQAWLQSQIDYAKGRGLDRWGVPYMGKVTGYFKERVNLPVSLVATLKGQRNEQVNRRPHDLLAIKQIMQATGKLPLLSTGQEYAPYITVAYDGSAWVNEGNHRIMAAEELNWDNIALEIRYFDGGQLIESGPLYPAKISKYTLVQTQQTQPFDAHSEEILMSVPVPNESALKSRVLDFAFDNKGFKRIESTGMLAASQNRTGRPIFILNGNFGREQFKLAHEEAKAAGIEFDKMYVFAETATYSGNSIIFMKLDEALPKAQPDLISSASAFQARLLAAQEMSDLVRSTGQRLKTNSDGSVTLFHSTSAKNRDAILREGAFTGNTWFGASKASTMVHAKPKHGADTVTIELRVDPRDVEFSTGTGEFYAPHGLRRLETGLWAPQSEKESPAASQDQKSEAIGFPDSPSGEFGQIEGQQYATAGEVVDGLVVRLDIPNRNSIEASVADFTVLPGVREISFDAFTQMGPLKYYSASEQDRTRELAQAIKASGEINPLIVVIDQEGPYVLEGGHRFDALRELGKSSFPALVVLDNESLAEKAPSAKAPPANPVQTSLADFDQWIEGTKVASRDGKPMVVYHRTASDFEQFDTTRGDLGAHFGSSAQAGNLHLGLMRDGERTIPVYLNLKNPIRLKDEGSFHADAVAPQLKRKGLIDSETAKRLFKAGDRGTVIERRQANTEIKKILKDAGYDGVVYANATEGEGDSFVAFDAEQIRFALPHGPHGALQSEVLMSVAAPVRIELKKDVSGIPYNPGLPAGVVNLDSPQVQLAAQQIAHLESAASRAWSQGRAAVMDVIRAEVQTVGDLDTLGPEQLTHIISNLASCQLGRHGRFDVEKTPEFAVYRQAKAALSLEQTHYHRVIAENSGRPLRESMPQLDEVDRPLTRTAQFVKWFKHSQVIDDQGVPLIAFHGTGRDIRQFNHPKKLDVGMPVTNGDWLGDLGNWFAAPSQDETNYEKGSAESTADVFAQRKGANGGAAIYPVFLSIQNPMEFFDYEELVYASQTYASSADMRNKLMELGYDGIVVRDCSTDGDQFRDDWVSFHPSQIKSALSNSGDFSLQDDDILMSVAAPGEINALGLFSALRRQVAKLDMASAHAPAWSDRITGLVNKGLIKDSEVQWSGLHDWLALQSGRISREQIVAYLDANGVQVQEAVLGEKVHTDFFVRRNGDMFEVVGYNGGIIAPDVSEEDATEIRDYYQETYGYSYKGSQPKYGEYTLPGGANYREVLLTLPAKLSDYGTWLDGSPVTAEDIATEHGRAAAIRIAGVTSFESTHWPGHSNILAHLRLTDRADPDGSRVLFVEELQSDWAQLGRREGFSSRPQDDARLLEVEKEIALGRLRGEPYRVVPLNNAKGEIEYWVAKGVGAQTVHVKDFSFEQIALARANELNRVDAAPDMKALYEERDRLEHKRAIKANTPSGPFVENTTAWVSLALKRIISMAVDGGYDKVAFINGEQTAQRFDLSKQVEYVRAAPLGDGRYNVAAFNARGEAASVNEEAVTIRRVASVFGKSLASKIENAPIGEITEFSGDDLNVGGFGMKDFYETILPRVTNDLLRKVAGSKLQSFEVGSVVANPTAGMTTYNVVDGKMVGSLDAKATMFDSLGMQTGFVITDALREVVHQDGLPMFSFAGAVEHASTDAALLQQDLVDLQRQGGELLSSLRKAVAAGAVPPGFASQQMRDIHQQAKQLQDELASATVAHTAEVVYHVTPVAKVARILEQGIATNIGERAAAAHEETAASYHFHSLADLEDALSGWLDDAFDEDEALAVLAVDVSGLNTSRADSSVHAAGYELQVFDHICANRVMLACKNVQSLDARALIERCASKAKALEQRSAGEQTKSEIRMSFAGAKARGADLASLALAKSEEPDLSWQAYGWTQGADGLWRFEIDDSEARVDVAALKNLQHGGFPNGMDLKKVIYRFDASGKCELLLVPPNPQKLTDMANFKALPNDVIEEMLSPQLLARMLAGEGEDDYIGDFEEAKMIDATGMRLKAFDVLHLYMVLDHPALFAAYPKLREVLVAVDPAQKQSACLMSPAPQDADECAPVISLRSVGYGEKHLRSMILHETQHVIQGIEGFAPGGTDKSALALQDRLQFQFTEQALARMLAMKERFPRTHAAYKALNDNFYMLLQQHGISAFDGAGQSKPMLALARELKAVQLPGQVLQRQALIAEYSRCMEFEIGQYGTLDYDQWMAAVQALTAAQNQSLEPGDVLYRRLGGEVESRNVPMRMLFTPAQRRETAPDSTADVAHADQLIDRN